jgi:glycosyltransferase involved in cell wall biosynthesis
VIPCYRSATSLPKLVERLSPVLREATAAHEIILVVDGSPDDTWAVASALAVKYEDVRAVRLARNYGQHAAIVAGVRSALFDVIVTMDDDLQHPPEEVPRLLAALTDDVDLVYAVSRREEHGVLRSLASRTVKAGLSGPLGVENAKSVSAFRAFRSFVRDSLDRVRGPHISVDVALSWATTKVTTAEVRMDRRSEGRSGYTLRALFQHAFNMILGYSTVPLRLVTYLGLATGAVGLALLGFVLVRYLTGETTVAGYTTTTAAIALFAAAQMVAIGVLGEYVGRIHSNGLGRPTYVVRERVE